MNQVTQGRQEASDAARLSNNNVIVVWRSAENGGDIKAQLLDPNGARIGGEFLVNANVTGEQRAPGVAALSSGGFVIAWANRPTLAIRGQVFTSTGGRQGGEFTWAMDNPFPTGSPYLAEYISVAGLSNGNFAVSWVELTRPVNPTPGFDSTVRTKVRVVSADGSLGPERLLGSGLPSSRIDATALSSGNFVVVYVLESAGARTFGHVFDPAGNQLGARFDVAPLESFFPSVTGLPSGGFAVAYSTRAAVSADVRVQEFSPLGVPSGVQQAIAVGRNPKIVLLDPVTTIIAYDAAQAPVTEQRNVFVRSTLVGGQPTRAPVLVNEVITGDREVSAIIPLGMGRVMVIWNDIGPNDPDGGIKARVFASAG